MSTAEIEFYLVKEYFFFSLDFLSLVLRATKRDVIVKYRNMNLHLVREEQYFSNRTFSFSYINYQSQSVMLREAKNRMNYILSCNCTFSPEPPEHAPLYLRPTRCNSSLTNRGEARANVASRLQEEKLKVRPRNVNNTRRASTGRFLFSRASSSRGAKPKAAHEGGGRRKKREKREEEKEEGNADRIPSRDRTR